MIILFSKKEDNEMKILKCYKKRRKEYKHHYVVVMDKANKNLNKT